MRLRVLPLVLIAGLMALGLAGCLAAAPVDTPTPASLPTASPTRTLVPTLTPTRTATPRVFPPPVETAATPVPPPADPLPLPSEVRVLLLVGLDRKDPFIGRSDALMLVFYHPRLAKAAFFSLPPDLFGYLPGRTMQRLSSAYSLGGADLLLTTLDYNFGVRPDSYLVANLDDFSILVDEIGGLIVNVLEPFPLACGDIIYPGDVLMNGEQALCYATLRDGMNEAARGRRQQELIRLVFERFLESGNLARVPELYPLIRPRLDTNITDDDVLQVIPLALRLGDSDRMAYFQVGPGQTEIWQISQQPPASVFLPRPDAIRALLLQAVDFISQPKPASDLVLTLEAELTTSPTATQTLEPSLTPTWTPVPIYSETPTFLPTPSLTVTYTPTLTPTVTRTFAP